MKKHLNIENKHLNIVKNILDNEQIEDVYVFGSRAKGNAKKLSDLDLLIKKPTSREQISRLSTAFDESDLPYKVDIVIWDEISDNFKENIRGDLILLSTATSLL